MKKNLFVLFCAAALTLSLAACAAPAETPGSEPAQQETAARVFTDDCGREVTLPAEITRIVPSGPLSQIMLFAIAPEMFVGVADPWEEDAYGLLPEEYLALPYLGQLYGSADLNVEELALADPQVIIDVGMTKDSTKEDLDTLQNQTGIPSVYISSSLETMPQTFRRLGELLGKEEKAEELAQFCERVYTRTLAIMEDVGEHKARALYVVGPDGLSVLAKGAFQAEVLDLLTENAAVVDNPLSKGTGNAVTMEQIALWDPEVILFSSDSIYEEVSQLDTWNQLTAISSGNYLEIPSAPHDWLAVPPAVQRYLSLIWLPAQLYPEYCDYDAKAEILEYYALFYGCELTDGQYEALIQNAVPASRR